jgi:hypothetical protein
MGVDTRELDQAPRVVRESLLFPYQEGLNWTRAVYKQGGWSQVSQAFTTLPQSTEQIMHPEKYLAHEAPVKVTLPDLTSLLNDSMKMTPGVKTTVTWKRILSDVNGEWGTYLLLDQFLKSPDDSRRAAAGWAGDRYAIYESSAGQIFYISSSTWDTLNDANEFYDAYFKRVQLRYPGAEAEASAGPNRPVKSQSWKTNEGPVTIKQDGLNVVVVEGYSEKLTAERLMRAVSR